jgi:DNA-nicking Smr family endonuclease
MNKILKVEKGSHLTVNVYESGYRELIWDDEALKRDVIEAVKAFENGTLVVKKPKATREKASKPKKESPKFSRDELVKMTKSQLKELGKREYNIVLDLRNKKDDLINQILKV